MKLLFNLIKYMIVGFVYSVFIVAFPIVALVQICFSNNFKSWIKNIKEFYAEIFLMFFEEA
ncbi:hypothetical protein [Paraliobacillus ryukyuensis]|uniref:hypothetical protein n=1 Tax=Paraliobacillus ryukyuensis TaxID=200904 RepID=UPI0009A6C4EC|nr:hypothetical protein [Paraliobacillus ryukyuensis]